MLHRDHRRAGRRVDRALDRRVEAAVASDQQPAAQRDDHWWHARHVAEVERRDVDRHVHVSRLEEARHDHPLVHRRVDVDERRAVWIEDERAVHLWDDQHRYRLVLLARLEHQPRRAARDDLADAAERQAIVAAANSHPGIKAHRPQRIALVRLAQEADGERRAAHVGPAAVRVRRELHDARDADGLHELHLGAQGDVRAVHIERRRAGEGRRAEVRGQRRQRRPAACVLHRDHRRAGARVDRALDRRVEAAVATDLKSTAYGYDHRLYGGHIAQLYVCELE